CGRVKDATLAFDIGVKPAGGDVVWLPTDTDPRFRIARGGCFRGGAPVPAGITTADIARLRIRAYPPALREGETTPAAGYVMLESVNKVFMLDKNFVPAIAPITWKGSLGVASNGTPTEIPITRR